MLHNLMLHCVLLPLVTGNAKHKAQHSTQCCTFTPSHMHQTKQHALWLPCQVVVSVLACPNMPQEPILAIGPVDEAERQSYEARRRRYGYPSGRECGWDGKPPWEGPATTPESISKPTLQEDPSDGVGCLFVAVRDQPTNFLCLVRALQQAHHMWRAIHVKLHPASTNFVNLFLCSSHSLATTTEHHRLLPHPAAIYSGLSNNNIAAPVVFANPKTFIAPCSLLLTTTAPFLPPHPTPPGPSPSPLMPMRTFVVFGESKATLLLV